MSLIGAIIMPHPPIILPEIGRGAEKEIRATTDACRAAAEKVAGWKPEALFLASPHATIYADYFHVSPGKSASGDMASFGAPQVKLKTEYDADLRAEFLRLAEAEGIGAGTEGERNPKLDHAVCVPLYFLGKAGVSCPVVRLGLSGFSPAEHYRLGQCAARAAENLGRRVVFVASGDLSHKLKYDGPYGYSEDGPIFDEEVTSAMKTADFLRFLTFDPDFCERAAECGLRSFQIMAGALDGLAVEPELLSYEGPFGVGYAVATFTATGRDEKRRFAAKYDAAEKERLKIKKAGEDPWVRLARLSLETYVRTGKRIGTLPDDLPKEMTERAAGTFVSLHVRGRLRGCMGTISPTTSNVAMEIASNAISAGTGDPRFMPVRESELDSLEYNVDVLGPAERIPGPEYLDVKRYGVIVSRGGRRGLLLPDLDGVDAVEEQIDIAREKGGIRPGEPYSLERFEVVRHK